MFGFMKLPIRYQKDISGQSEKAGPDRIGDTGDRMLDDLNLTGTLDALAVLAARRPGHGEAAGTVETVEEACRRVCATAAPGADPRSLTWGALLAAAAGLGLRIVNLDPAGRVVRAFQAEAAGPAVAAAPAVGFDAAVEALKAALVGVMVQADAPGGKPLAGVLAAVPLQEGVLAVVVRALARRKDGTLIASVAEPGYPDVQYQLDGICILAAAACQLPS